MTRVQNARNRKDGFSNASYFDANQSRDNNGVLTVRLHTVGGPVVLARAGR
jgi:hypothetical protein